MVAAGLKKTGNAGKARATDRVLIAAHVIFVRYVRLRMPSDRICLGIFQAISDPSKPFSMRFT